MRREQNYYGPPEHLFIPGGEEYEMTVCGSDGVEIELQGVRPTAQSLNGFTIVADPINIHQAATWERVKFYYKGRQVGNGTFRNGPVALIEGDQIHVSHTISLPSELAGRFGTIIQMIEAYFTILDAEGRLAWREVFECLERS